jgi:hypothetical protein
MTDIVAFVLGHKGINARLPVIADTRLPGGKEVTSQPGIEKRVSVAYPSIV